MGQERIEDGSRIEQRWVKDRAKMGQGWSRNGSRMEQKWVNDGAEMGEGWSTDGLINERYGFDLREEVRLK